MILVDACECISLTYDQFSTFTYSPRYCANVLVYIVNRIKAQGIFISAL